MEGTTWYKSTAEERHVLRITRKLVCSRTLGYKLRWLSWDTTFDSLYITDFVPVSQPSPRQHEVGPLWINIYLLKLLSRLDCSVTVAIRLYFIAMRCPDWSLSTFILRLAVLAMVAYLYREFRSNRTQTHGKQRQIWAGYVVMALIFSVDGGEFG
jgi:hypothetical protein